VPWKRQQKNIFSFVSVSDQSAPGELPPSIRQEGTMSVSSLPVGKFQFPWRVRKGAILRARGHAALTAALEASLARERASQQANALLQRSQKTLALEFDHRFVNGLQWITALLTLQSRGATPEAAEQLAIAARRVAAFGSVHRRLHLLDNQRTVEFRQYLLLLCKDLSGLLLRDDDDDAITVEGPTVEIRTATAIPLGFIVNELITNAAKYARGKIIVQLGGTPAGRYSLSVLDDGPGMPAEFDLARCKGLGTKIVLTLVKQIGGELKIMPGDNGRGTKFTVIF
jgi:two-component system, sensor histidine kinase PdtaS